MANTDPKDVTVSEGLAKMREAADKLTEEEVAELAEEAKKAVIESQEAAARKR
ncbi:hypothetical protein HC231_15060 [Brenneria izadpanahii]|uniref:Uncharacterized protein n=1 Tax=Brenneria izadpanahii TaxID=2722756 RepID=A0ABX7UW39_9GAMM|nr:hypothetical protein [Brenneria izadpanahii]QTF09076.1 hypothetical protein HC231_15060 [Brenneria izadpanahii]